ncbi:DeoR/GlpR family DNA-binding transcription regulator [Tropicimonas isoalkanivorans]|uniref:Transcriptional regulator, DeoR family n=1 Tax=Tropicimonas isoalkanivorans TaxID=441112 RepID=A0A1I1PI23_9RHOB|nr:DeoR/GlpR family DNA-binding transcription regulator [Tropicimonas isoalkanivorans]SFD06633.1 transcriptional regulator, DeoR family [Tropicimonas isoalkanivorans]
MPSDPVLNSPEGRQSILRARAAAGAPLPMAALAEEFGVSVDTIRRDLLALEAEGAIQRVRGGALPVMQPVEPLVTRMRTSDAAAHCIASRALDLIEDGMVVMLDGGTTIARLAAKLPPLPHALIITPAPAVAVATLAAGIETVLIGGQMSALGGMAVGQRACEAVSATAADLCLLGACGLEPTFGLSADRLDEAAVKAAMGAASSRTAVLTDRSKLGRRARHRVVPCAKLDVLVTDASSEETAAFHEVGLEIRCA